MTWDPLLDQTCTSRWCQSAWKQTKIDLVNVHFFSSDCQQRPGLRMPNPHPPSPGNTTDSQQKPRWVKLTKEPLFQSQRAAAQLPLFQGELRLRARHETNFWYHLSPRLAGFCGLWFCPEDVWDLCFKLRGTWLSCNLLIGVPVRFLSKRQKIFVLTVNVIRRSFSPPDPFIYFFFCKKFEIHSATEASAFTLKELPCFFSGLRAPL